MNNNIKVLFWDIDGTLVNLKDSIYYALEKTFKYLNIENKFNEDVFKTFLDENIIFWSAFERGEININEVLLKRFENLFDKYDIDIDPSIVSDIYEPFTYEKSFAYEGMIQLVKDCKNKYKQYVTTNGLHSVQKGKLITNNIVNVFDAIFISEDMGFPKPHSNFFNNCFKYIGDYKKDELMIIGDSLTSDMKGANNFGIKCCFINRNNIDTTNLDIKLDYIIDDENDLRKILL